jgi:hypothetical protein
LKQRVFVHRADFTPAQNALPRLPTRDVALDPGSSSALVPRIPFEV